MWYARSLTIFVFGALAFLATGLSGAVVIEMVTVGNAGNAADTRYDPTGFGAVNYAYNVGKYEVTAGQYTAFLNAVGGVDTYALYNTNMSRTDYGSGITRIGGGTVVAPYTYTVATDFVNRPVNHVSYWDTCRFANWLHNHQKTTAQDPNVTEHGAYTLTTDGISNNTILRNTDWKWAVTSEDEWYKAAYHKNDGNSGNYWDYPTKTALGSPPGRDMTESTNPGNNANIYGSPYPIDGTHHTTVKGEFELSESAYHTFDQGGNVWEWNNSILSGSSRGLRGGSCGVDELFLRASRRFHGTLIDPSVEDSALGFRVASVGEPDSIVTEHRLFYNNSTWDGFDDAANWRDDDAMALEKTALLPGETGGFRNYTSYSRGINGVVVDIAGPWGTLTADDFQFKVGNDDHPETWADAPAPTMVAVRPGEGANGSDRVTIVWPDNAIQNEWLQVTMLANEITGLPEDDVFYFGNAIGETGNSPTDAKVNAFDMLGARDNPRSFLDPAPIDFAYDFNRDSRVNSFDMLVARDNPTSFLNALRLITTPAKAADARTAPVPEPSSLALLAVGALGLTIAWWRRKHSA